MNRLVILGFILSLLIASGQKPCFATPRIDQPEIQEIKITARRFEFNPRTITVRKGEPVKITFTSEDADHGLAISDLDIDLRVRARQTKSIEFTPDREGKFKISCSVFCGDGHPDMEGELVVTGNDADATSNMKVSFADDAPGVVIVESNGERIRIDTATKTVSRLADDKPTTTEPPVMATAQTEQRRAPEPYDYRLVNVPTPKRVPRHSLNVHFTHRFTSPINQDETTFGQQLETLFGLDSFAVSSLGFSFGITDRLYANVYRSPICRPGLCKTIELGLGYHLLDEAGRSPLALSAYASIEGNNNFREEFTYNIQAMLARSVTRYVNVFFSPAVHINSNGQGRFNPRSDDFFPNEPLADEFELGQHTGSFGFGVNARIRPTASITFEYTPRVGFKMGRAEPVFDQGTGSIVGFRNLSEPEIGFGIEKRLGRHSFSLTFSNTQATTTSRYNSSNLVLPPSKLIIGFNLFRRLM
ncbi:MAG: DUF5777 family beta-barrel protein [Blastocatellia bacterium]|nr:DUF5777 family beta-barrel protein [Blastocatellia bacterium]